MTRSQSPAHSALGPLGLALTATLVLGVLAPSGAAAEERQRSASERDTSRQTVRPGEPASSRREPSRLRNAEEPAPTVQNRAPEVLVPQRPEAAAPGAAGGR